MKPLPPCCHQCSSTDVRIVAGVESFTPVSSDIRIVPGSLQIAVCGRCGLLQKLVTDGWRADIERIYDQYDLNHQSGGADPVVFNSVYGPGPRAAILVRHLADLHNLPSRGSVLDIGCANGNILRSLSSLRPDWKLYGMERSVRWRSAVSSIAGFDGFFTALDELGDRRFDLIVMSHVLEHIPGPAAFLRRLLQHLSEAGSLFVAVPDIRQNPIDLFVLDHCSHFDETSLDDVLRAGGFTPVSIDAGILGKEIVAASRVAGDGDAKPPIGNGFLMPPATVAEKYVALCADVMRCARELRANCPRFGIMGTSTAAAWLAGELKLAVDFFVDEDPQRIGHAAFGKPIHSLASISAGACVFIPMSNRTAEAIIARAKRPDVRFAYLPWNQIDDVRALSPVCG